MSDMSFSRKIENYLFPPCFNLSTTAKLFTPLRVKKIQVDMAIFWPAPWINKHLSIEYPPRCVGNLSTWANIFFLFLRKKNNQHEALKPFAEFWAKSCQVCMAIGAILLWLEKCLLLNNGMHKQRYKWTIRTWDNSHTVSRAHQPCKHLNFQTQHRWIDKI